VIVILTILCLAAGAFFQRIWSGSKKSKESSTPTTPPGDPIASVNRWLKEGQAMGFVDAGGLLAESTSRTGKELADFKHWLTRSPDTAFLQGETLSHGERTRLERLFWVIFVYLIAVGIVAGLGIYLQWNMPQPDLLIAVCGGLFGSTIAAFRSCVDRRAGGFEDRYGNSSPKSESKRERFGDGMMHWFIARPFLGAGVGLLIYSAVAGNVFPEEMSKKLSLNTGSLVFYICLAGLLAKTLLDIFLEAGKKIFRVD
jgi:hypothetical protein